MLAFSYIEWLFALLVTIVFVNRYVFGSFLRISDSRTQIDHDVDPPVWPSDAIIVPVYNEGETILKTADAFNDLDYPTTS